MFFIMCNNTGAVFDAICSLSESLKTLHNLGVIRSKKWKDDYGEWLVCQLFDGVLADSRTQEGWDLKVNDENVQVKCHFIPDRGSKYTLIKSTSSFDTLIIVGLTESLKVGVMYRIRKIDLMPLLVSEKGRGKDVHRVMWSQLDRFTLSHKELMQAKGMSALIGM